MACEIIYGGSTITFDVIGTDIDLDAENFDLWHYVDKLGFISKINKSAMTKIESNHYRGAISSEDSAKFKQGQMTMAIRLLNLEGNLVSVTKVERIFFLETTLIGGI